MVNFGAVGNIIGVLIGLLGGLMLTTLAFSTYYASGDAWAILLSALVTITSGAILWWVTRQTDKKLGKREGYLVVALGWLATAVFSCLPYVFSGTFPSITNAFFESVSGLTTTGASVLNDIEAVPKGILFWRSLTQ